MNNCDSIHLITGYDGDSTVIVPKVPTIFRGRGENKNAITPITSL